eukprot:1130384-Pyramimonas_sp.AAC.1
MLGTLPPYKRGGVPCANARKRLRALFAPVTCGGGACKTCPQALCSNKRCPGTVQSATPPERPLAGGAQVWHPSRQKYLSLGGPRGLGVVGGDHDLHVQLECLLDGQPQKAWTHGAMPPLP